MTENRLHTFAEVQKTLAVSNPTVRKLVREGRLEAVRLGRAVRITGASVQRLMGAASNAEAAR